MRIFYRNHGDPVKEKTPALFCSHAPGNSECPRLFSPVAQRSRCVSGRRPVPTRQRHAQRPASHLGWARPCPSRALYGGAGGHAEESRDSGVLSAPLSGGESEEVGVDRLHAQTAHDSQCDAEEWDAVAGGGQSACLTFKTVAVPFSPSCFLLKSRGTFCISSHCHNNRVHFFLTSVSGYSRQHLEF